MAGAPRVGKSWLSLWFCLQMVKGELAWAFPTTQGDVLYLCLEDSYSRIQNRLLDITDDAPPNLFFATMSEKLHSGLEQQIERFLAAHPDTVLVVIDTLQRIRGGINDVNPYANDYCDLGILKELYRFAGEQYKPNVLMKKLLRCQQELLELGITLSTRRTHDRRKLTLRVSCVSNDGKNDTGPVSDLLSQPSQLSQERPAPPDRNGDSGSGTRPLGCGKFRLCGTERGICPARPLRQSGLSPHPYQTEGEWYDGVF